MLAPVIHAPVDSVWSEPEALAKSLSEPEALQLFASGVEDQELHRVASIAINCHNSLPPLKFLPLMQKAG
jgi:hypothetical protein